MRIAYVTAGIVIAIAFNCLVLPVNLKKATHHLAQKYIQVTQAVSESYRRHQPDLQLHYHLVLDMHRLEDKLRQNAVALEWDDVHSFIWNHQKEVWQARKASFA